MKEKSELIQSTMDQYLLLLPRKKKQVIYLSSDKKTKQMKIDLYMKSVPIGYLVKQTEDIN